MWKDEPGYKAVFIRHTLIMAMLNSGFLTKIGLLFIHYLFIYVFNKYTLDIYKMLAHIFNKSIVYEDYYKGLSHNWKQQLQWFLYLKFS